MNDWDPATEAEAAMRDALAGADQELYFRILARSELLLPVSADALAGRAPMGWGTWTTGNRTHILAFTSPSRVAHLPQRAGRVLPGGPVPFVGRRLAQLRVVARDQPGAADRGVPAVVVRVAAHPRRSAVCPGRTMGARARMAQSDLAAALGGRGAGR